MVNNERTFKDWIIATRPWSFPASSMSVIVTSAYLYWKTSNEGGNFDWINAAIALVMMVCFQAAGNLISDYYDHKKGVDLPGSYNGVRHIQSGKFAPKTILHYGFTFAFISALLGVVILLRTGIEPIWIGIAGTLLALFYPWLKYHAMGDYTILLAYALLPSIGTGLVVTGEYHPFVLLLSLTYGLMTVAILHANNTRDIMNDSRAGITTLAIQLGGCTCQWVYMFEVLIPYVLIIIFCFTGNTAWWSMLVFLILPITIKKVSIMMKAEPNSDLPIATLDQQTAQMQLQFSLILTLSFVLSIFF